MGIGRRRQAVDCVCGLLQLYYVQHENKYDTDVIEIYTHNIVLSNASIKNFLKQTGL